MTPRRPPPVAALFFTVVFATSLTASILTPLNSGLWTAAITSIIAVLGLLTTSSRFRRSAVICAISLFAAHTSVIYADNKSPSDHRFVEWLEEDRHSAEIGAVITDGPTFHDRGVSFDARLTDIDIDPDRILTDPSPKIRIFYPTENLAPCSRLPLPGDRVRTWAQMERFEPAHAPWRTSYRRLMEARGYSASVTVKEPLQFADDLDDSFIVKIQRPLSRHRVALERRIAEYLDGDALAVATAMLTGSRGELTPEFREPFDVTSTGHILAISGLHFAVIAGLIALLVRFALDRFPHIYRRRPRRMLIGLLTLVFLLIYLLAIGAPVSARRAFGMTALAITIISFSPWRLKPLSALMVTGAVLLLIRPTLVMEVGYQLSVTATAGIILFMRYRPPVLRPPNIPGPESEPRSHKLLRRFGTFAGLSASATLATWPILLRMTGELPLAGLWVNMIVVPLVGTILFPILVAGALLTSIWPAAAELLLTISTTGLLIIRDGLDFIAYASGTSLRWGTPSMLEFIGLLVAVTIAIVGGLRPRWVLTALITTMLAALPGWIVDATGPRTTQIHFIAVGQGDATLIEASDGTTVLIDAGGRPVGSDPGLQRVVPYLRHRGINRLDAVILTHGDYDHYGGLSAVIRPFRPKKFLVDAAEENHRVIDLKDQMATSGTAIIDVENTSVIATDDVDLHVIRPDLPGAADNDRSLTVSFSYASAVVVLPGDLETAGEAWLVDRIQGPAAIVKAPHHGSNTSSSPKFLDHFQPAVAFSSSGRHNRFGHPHPDVITRYNDREIDLFRTDQQGSIVVSIQDDGEIRVAATR